MSVAAATGVERIAGAFARAKAERRLAVLIYLTVGYPDRASTGSLLRAAIDGGADLLELGVPFSDPLADGLVNQLAAQRGLESGATPPKVLETVAAIRRDSEIPVVLYIYFNLAYRYGLEKFIHDAAKAGVDGLLVLDLPPEESGDYEPLMRAAGLCNIYLVAPTTPDDRIERIVKRATGFIYYISREGVTGMQEKVAANLAQMTARIRKHTELPIAVGFGISNPEQAKRAASCADAVVVGSAVVNQIAACGKTAQTVSIVSQFVQSLADAVKCE
jgi:tryptophan synthase alpha chain